MKKALLILFFSFIALSVFSSRPNPAYHFSAPEFEKYVPFTKAQLELFKKQGVTKIKVKTPFKYYFMYYLNEKGLVYLKEERSFLGELYNSFSYTYYVDGFCTVIKQKYYASKKRIYMEVYDSISYDMNNKIEYYLNAVKEYDNSGCEDWCKDEYKLDSVKGNLRYFTNSNNYGGESRQLVMNGDNEFIRVYAKSQSDSVSFKQVSENEFIKEYWVKPINSTKYTKGRIQYFKDGVKVKEDVYRLYGGEFPRYEIEYTYNELGQLATEYEKTLNRLNSYTYDENGLLLKEKETPRNRFTNNYTYKYYY